MRAGAGAAGSDIVARPRAAANGVRCPYRCGASRSAARAHECAVACFDTAFHEVLERSDDRAALALAVDRHHLRAGIAAMAAALGGLDALVFTGGVAERAPAIRAAAAGGLAFLGVAVEAERNRAADGDTDVSAPDAAVRPLVVAAGEDLEIAAQVRAVLG
jgi:acetate kinase